MYCTRCETELIGFNRFCGRCGAPTPIACFDLDSEKGIKAIPIPRYDRIHGLASPVNNIEYILQRKATEHKRNGRMDLAIACLRKSNEMFPSSNFAWKASDYLRLVEFLKQDGQFGEARKEEAKIQQQIQAIEKSTSRTIEETNMALGYDLTEFHSHESCPLCSVYHGRVFSISGKDKRFPPFSMTPTAIRDGQCPVCGVRGCWITYVDELRTRSEIRDATRRSNRPFVDERTVEQKEQHESRVASLKEAREFSLEYDWLRENLPDLAPKSSGGYTRMKRSNSANFQKLKAAAAEKGFEIK